MAARPVTTTGYDTFGEAAEAQDPDGDVTSYAYDADGRQVTQTLPGYTQPGGSSPVNGTSTTTYNALGQVTAQEDADGNTTRYSYDQLGDRTGQTDPGGGVTTASYDADGEQLSQTGPTGAQTTGTYDYLGRQVTATSVERYPAAASYTTVTSYAATPADPSGTWKSLVTSPDGVTSSYGYDAAGEATQVTDGAGNTTRYSFDALGRPAATVYPDGTSTTVSYDPAGNKVAQSSLDASGHTLTTETAAYDGEGRQLSATDALGGTTAFTYDPAGTLTAETQPVTSSSGIITSFGYDAAGNQTRYTDGNGSNWLTTYNSRGLPETQAEPATSQYSSAADSATTVAYDGNGKPASVTEPGGVALAYSYDSMGDLTGQSGSGATAPTAARSFTYDTAGDMLTAATTSTAGSGQPSNATSESFTYDDRGLVLTASGSAGSTAYTWNGDGEQASAADAAGTASYSYDSAGRLHAMSDPASGATLTYSYNPMSQVSQVAYGGTGTDVRSFGYNSLHELTSDTLTHGSTTVASVSYGYDLDGHVTSKAAAGFAGASASTYGYDQAGRLTSWDNGTATTTYAYDGDGNRTRAGSTSYTYDARDELTSDGTKAYTYAADGDLTSAGGVTSTSDAYGQQGAQGTQSDTYDALGRDTATTVTGGATTTLSYEGTTGQLAGDGASTYTWTPGGTLAGTAAAGSSGGGVLDFTDAHTDLTGQFTAAGTTLAGSQAFGPWGAVTAAGGTLTGSLGYQSQFTSPATGQVDMGARWYNPATATFGNKDTTANKPVPDSASASPFGYAADNPLTLTDPTGHSALDAHQLHEAHLAHLANVAQQAAAAKPVTKPAAPAPNHTSPRFAGVDTGPVFPAAAKPAPANPLAECGYILTLKGCAGQLRSRSFIEASPTQRTTDYNASKTLTAEANKAAVKKPAAPAAKPKDASAVAAQKRAAQLATVGEAMQKLLGVAFKGRPAASNSLLQYALAAAEGGAAGALTVLNALQGGADPATDSAEAADLAALEREAAADSSDGTAAESTAEKEAAACGGNSFTASTRVLLASGAAIPISQLKVGDRVLATSTSTSKTQAELVP